MLRQMQSPELGAGNWSRRGCVPLKIEGAERNQKKNQKKSKKTEAGEWKNVEGGGLKERADGMEGWGGRCEKRKNQRKKKCQGGGKILRQKS